MYRRKADKVTGEIRSCLAAVACVMSIACDVCLCVCDCLLKCECMVSVFVCVRMSVVCVALFDSLDSLFD